MIKREYKKVKLTSLLEYSRNNKIHANNVDEIVKSIQANTYISPIIINKEGLILAGHGRKLAMERLGMEEAEVLQIT
jgi:ParB-like chromosome segregation protein Spo0J